MVLQEGSKVSVLMAVRCQHQVVIVGRIFKAQSINWLLDRRQQRPGSRWTSYKGC